MRLRFVLLLGVLPWLAACNNDPLNDWSTVPDTALLYSLSRPELIGQPSAYDFVNGVPLAVENPGVTGRWDVALTDAGSGTLALVPAGGFSGLDSRAGIATMGNVPFDQVTDAPSDTASYSKLAVPMKIGTVYVIRTRRETCGLGNSVKYGKFEPLVIDVAKGTMQFRSVVNPFCGDRRLVPPK